ncbi:MAG: vanadium-dependent haloperoxidase [Caldilineaceae bacterium]
MALAAETYAKVGIAVADAFIGCWQTKYQYNRVRPLTYIQLLIDPLWNTPTVTTPVVTPPFPEYTSGHSVQAGAVAEVLTGMFGNQLTFTDHTHERRGFLPRSYDSFWAMANEAAISRLYGGIHYRDAIENGLEQGPLYWSTGAGAPLQGTLVKTERVDYGEFIRFVIDPLRVHSNYQNKQSRKMRMHGGSYNRTGDRSNAGAQCALELCCQPVGHRFYYVGHQPDLARDGDACVDQPLDRLEGRNWLDSGDL